MGLLRDTPTDKGSSCDQRRKAKGEVDCANDVGIDVASEPNMFAAGVNTAE